MKAVILAAGKSTRTYPLTLNRPKTLLRVANKPVLEHNLEALKGIDEAIIVVGFGKEMIMDYFGEEFRGIKLNYVEQKEQLGTGHALLTSENHVKGRFIVMNGDDVYCEDNIKALLEKDYSLLVERMKDPSALGIWIVEKGMVKGFEEKPKKFISDLANCGLYVLDEKIFPELKKLEKSERGEYELNEAVNMLAQREKIHAVETVGHWLPIAYPWHVLETNENILNGMEKSEINGEVEPNATIKGLVKIGKGTLVRNGAYIEGPVVIGDNCVIGPNCFIRACTSIGDNCRIGNGVEIKNCVIGDGTKIPHLSYIGDSVLGDNINLGAGTITANIRHDRENVKMLVRGERIDSKRRKLGAIIGDNVKTGIKTLIYPGRKIFPGKTTLPGEIVSKDIE